MIAQYIVLGIALFAVVTLACVAVSMLIQQIRDGRDD